MSYVSLATNPQTDRLQNIQNTPSRYLPTPYAVNPQSITSFYVLYLLRVYTPLISFTAFLFSFHLTVVSNNWVCTFEEVGRLIVVVLMAALFDVMYRCLDHVLFVLYGAHKKVAANFLEHKLLRPERYSGFFLVAFHMLYRYIYPIEAIAGYEFRELHSMITMNIVNLFLQVSFSVIPNHISVFLLAPMSLWFIYIVSSAPSLIAITLLCMVAPKVAFVIMRGPTATIMPSINMSPNSWCSHYWQSINQNLVYFGVIGLSYVVLYALYRYMKKSVYALTLATTFLLSKDALYWISGHPKLPSVFLIPYVPMAVFNMTIYALGDIVGWDREFGNFFYYQIGDLILTLLTLQNKHLTQTLQTLIFVFALIIEHSYGTGSNFLGIFFKLLPCLFAVVPRHLYIKPFVAPEQSH